MRRFVATFSTVLIAIAVLGACGGSESNSGLGASGTNASNNSSPGGSGSSDNFSKLYADAANKKFKVTFTTADGSATTYGQDGNGKSFWSSGDTQYFTSSTGSVTCSTSSGAPTCTQVPGNGTTSPFLGFYNGAKAYVGALASYGDKSSKTIAGRDAQCVTISAASVAGKGGPAIAAVVSGIKGSLKYCVDTQTGVLLEAVTTDADGKNTTEFTVTKFEEPSDSDFTPPATASTISVPPGYTVPSIPSYTIPGGG